MCREVSAGVVVAVFPVLSSVSVLFWCVCNSRKGGRRASSPPLLLFPGIPEHPRAAWSRSIPDGHDDLFRGRKGSLEVPNCFRDLTQHTCRLLLLRWGVVDGWAFYVASVRRCRVKFLALCYTRDRAFLRLLACALRRLDAPHLRGTWLLVGFSLSCRHSSHSIIIGRLFGSATTLWSRVKVQ